jgi:N,N'-diacetylchitobiose transport system permease protein
MSTIASNASPRADTPERPMPARTPAGRRPRSKIPAFLRGPALLLVPAFGVIAVFTGYPLARLIIMSFQKYGRAQIFGAPPEFVGLDNYVNVLTDHQFWVVLGRSIAFCATCVIATMVLGVGVAVLLTRLGKVMKTLVSIGLVLAWAMPPVSATTVGAWLFDSRRGLVNYLITEFTPFNFTGHSWLNNPVSFFFVAMVVITWMSVPFVAFTTFAALSQVPPEVLEAASLDGTGGWQRFRLIVVPSIRPVLLILLVLQVIWDMRVFTQIYTLQTVGGIIEDTNTIGPYIYQISTARGDLGSGGAIAVLLVIIMLAFSAYYIRSLLREEEA